MTTTQLSPALITFFSEPIRKEAGLRSGAASLLRRAVGSRVVAVPRKMVRKAMTPPAASGRIDPIQLYKNRGQFVGKVRNRLDDSLLAPGAAEAPRAAYAGYRATPAQMFNRMTGNTPVSRRQFLAFIAGSGGRAAKQAVPYEVRAAGKSLLRAERAAAPFVNRYATTGVLANPAIYAAAAKTLPTQTRNKLWPWLIGGGTATGGAMVGGAALGAMD